MPRVTLAQLDKELALVTKKVDFIEKFFLVILAASCTAAVGLPWVIFNLLIKLYLHQ